MFKSLLRFKGPGNTFASPISSSVTDSPYRLAKFKLRPIRHDFQNVLVSADNLCLERAAKEIISMKSSQFGTNEDNDKVESSLVELGRKAQSEKLVSKSRGFWIVFSKRIKASAYILPPKTISLVLRAFYTANKDTGIYTSLVNPIKYIVKSIDGTSLYWIVTVMSRRLKKNCNMEFFDMLANHLPNVLYQISGPMAIEICNRLYESGYSKPNICNNVGLKAVKSKLDLKDAILAVFVFGLFKFNNEIIHSELEKIILRHIDQLNTIDIARVSIGFYRSSYDPARVLNLLQDKVKTLSDIPKNYLDDFKTSVHNSSCIKSVKDIVCNL